MAGKNTVQTVGNFTASLSHPLLYGGAAITLKGFKLEDTFVSTQQMMDNSKIIPLVDGGTVTITNALMAGKLTINALRVSTSAVEGDLPLLATQLQGLADNAGGTLRFSFGFDNQTESITFFGVTLVSCPPILLAGNDLPVYPVVFNYANFVRGT